MPEFNQTEKEVIKMMFKSLSIIIEACGDSIEVKYNNFDSNDLYRLFHKMDIGDFWE